MVALSLPQSAATDRPAVLTVGNDIVNAGVYSATVAVSSFHVKASSSQPLAEVLQL